jgi:hypothetical protein
MIRAREFPRPEVVSIERVCWSSRQRRPARGVGGRIVVLAKAAALCAGYFVGVYGGFLWFIGTKDELPDVANIGGIIGVVCAVGCSAGMLRATNAAPWLVDHAWPGWLVLIAGGVCAVGFMWWELGIVVPMLIGGAP